MFEHSEDIDIDRSVNVHVLDDQMTAVLHRVADNLEESNLLSRSPRQLMSDILRSFIDTHKSIRSLLSHRDVNISLAADAASLVREQVEKVFMVTLLADDPDKWEKIHGKDGWRQMYEYFLQEGLELGNLPKRKEFFSVIGPKLVSEGCKLFGVTDLEKEATEFRFENPGIELPEHLKGHTIEQFPTPGMAVKEVATPKREFLARWHREYKKLCGYSHVGYKKLILSIMSGRRANFSEGDKRAYFDKEILELFTESYISAASSCVEVHPLLEDLSTESIQKIVLFWDELKTDSLLGKTFWEIHARAQLAQYPLL